MEDFQATQNSVIVRRLTKTYGAVKAISNVSFRIAKGEVVGFLGPNGAGKSTTMRIIAGLVPATSGSVEICGESVALNPDGAKRHLAFMPENNPLPEDLRVREYLSFRARIKGVEDVRSSVDEAMEVCQLRRKASSWIIGNLSKGFRQRVGIADAILAKPDLIIMDEPTIGLDPHQILAIRSLINSLRGKMSVILSSHILPEIELMCDRVMIINQGVIVATGAPEALRNDFIARDRYSVSLKADPESMKRMLSALGRDIEMESNTEPDAAGYVEYVLSVPRGDDVGAVLIGEFSKDTRLSLREVAFRKPTLEEIFMAATRRGWEEIRKNSKRDGEEDEI